ncbi:MAG: hypothetical protein P8170_13645 [Gemmatimonadota bacterium]
MNPRTARSPARDAGHDASALMVPMAFAAALAAMAMLPMIRGHARLFPTVLTAASVLGVWGLTLFLSARAENRQLILEAAVKKQHWVQACAQIAIFLYWGWYVRTVYAFFPLILAQLLFAYGVDGLLCLSRRDTYRVGFGPVPIVLSINLFLLFRPDWFHWQFAMILVGYLGKELIRWRRDGRSAHIFNPSSFPLGVFSIVLLVTGSTDVTLGPFIAQSQFVPPYIYALIFLVSIPGQILFGVARMTVAAVISMVAISFVYLEVTGTYMFRDAFISLPVFLGMHLLFTDPSTSPRSESGQLAFGMLYAVGITGFFFLLDSFDLPTFYEKLLPVPLMNLMVRRIDLIARSETLRWLDPARIGEALSPLRRNLAYTAVWIGVFGVFRAVGVLGDNHPGQYYPFWRDACEAGSARACEYRAFMAFNYCNRGSGWACNEHGIFLVGRGRRTQALEAFRQSCELGFEAGCQNADRDQVSRAPWERGLPHVEDLPIVLRGSKGPVTEEDPGVLLTMACEQGWPLCDAVPPGS